MRKSRDVLLYPEGWTSYELQYQGWVDFHSKGRKCMNPDLSVSSIYRRAWHQAQRGIAPPERVRHAVLNLNR